MFLHDFVLFMDLASGKDGQLQIHMRVLDSTARKEGRLEGRKETRKDKEKRGRRKKKKAKGSKIKR